MNCKLECSPACLPAKLTDNHPNVIFFLPSKDNLQSDISRLLKTIFNVITSPYKNENNYAYFISGEIAKNVCKELNKRHHSRNKKVEFVNVNNCQSLDEAFREVTFHIRHLSSNEIRKRWEFLKQNKAKKVYKRLEKQIVEKPWAIKNNLENNHVNTKSNSILNDFHYINCLKKQLIIKTTLAQEDFIKKKLHLTHIQIYRRNIFINSILKDIKEKIFNNLQDCAKNLIDKNQRKFNIDIFFLKTLNDSAIEILDDDFIDGKYPLLMHSERKMFKNFCLEFLELLSEKVLSLDTQTIHQYSRKFS